MPNPGHRAYALITPAHNEAGFIERTIRSVTAQTIVPLRYVIVSDNSSDGTDDIVVRFARDYPFIRYVRKSSDDGRNTASKVLTFNQGLRCLDDIPYDYLGNLDADVSFEPGYFEFLLRRFDDDPSLGIAGGRIHQLDGGRFTECRSSMESVAGAVQLFRRECFEEIGGYLPLKGGYEDGVAEISARRNGWRTRSYRELVVRHHRGLGTVNRSIWSARFRAGINERDLGFGYLYHLARLATRSFEKPVLLGSFLVGLGYLWALATRRKHIMGDDFVCYLREEQRNRLRERIVGTARRIGAFLTEPSARAGRSR